MLARTISKWHLTAVALMAAALMAAVSLAAGENAPKPKAGEMAPAITLKDQAGKSHTLADYKGKWVVVYFYPKDQTPGCTTQACEFRDNIFAFRKADAIVLGVSVDDEASHKEFAEKHGLPFPLLADVTHDTAKRYGVLGSFGPMTIAQRDTFLIDPTGKIAKHYEKVKPEGHSLIVLDDIKAFKAAKGSKG